MKTAMKRLYAKGRLRPGEMNATESAYAAFLKAEQQAGRIEKFLFAPMKVNRAYKVGHDVGLKGSAPSVEAAQYKTKLEQRYFWLGVCDAQVEKNNREDESE